MHFLHSSAHSLILEVPEDLSCLHSALSKRMPMSLNMNMDEFTINSDVHSINARQRTDLHPPLIKLTKYKKGVYYSGIKIFNCLPQKIKKLSWNVKKFKQILNKFLLMGSFYTLEEYFDWTSRSDLGTYV